MVEVKTGSGMTVSIGTDVSKVTIGNDTVTDGVGVGCNGAPANATPLIISEAVAVTNRPSRDFNLPHPADCDLFFTNMVRAEVNR